MYTSAARGRMSEDLRTAAADNELPVAATALPQVIAKGCEDRTAGFDDICSAVTAESEAC